VDGEAPVLLDVVRQKIRAKKYSLLLANNTLNTGGLASEFG
jgi:hypothetical protein